MAVAKGGTETYAGVRYSSVEIDRPSSGLGPAGASIGTGGTGIPGGGAGSGYGVELNRASQSQLTAVNKQQTRFRSSF